MENRENRQEEMELEQILREMQTASEEGSQEIAAKTEASTVPEARAEDPKPTAAAPKRGTRAKKEGSSLLADLVALLLRIGWISFVFAILLLVICGVMVNNGPRMAPAFHDRDVVIYYRLAKDIKAGEVVVYRGDNNQLLLGRVAAKAGDTVDIDEKGIRINGYYQEEPFAVGDTVLFEGGTSLPVTLRTGEYFVLCDDRSQSADSRIFGPISSDRICGRVMLMIRQRDF